MTGDVVARQRLLELTRDRLMSHARRHLHGRHLPKAEDLQFPFRNSRANPLKSAPIFQHQSGVCLWGNLSIWVEKRRKTLRNSRQFRELYLIIGSYRLVIMCNHLEPLGQFFLICWYCFGNGRLRASEQR